MKTIFLVIILLLSFQVSPQLIEGIVVSNEGEKMNVSIKDFNKNNGPSKSMEALDSLGNQFKISPDSHLTLIIGNKKYESIKDKRGKKRFMEVLDDGERIKLYSHYSSYTMNVPGEGLSSGFILEYYMKRGQAVFFVDKNLLKRYPERFYPGNMELIEKIKRTKKRNYEIVLWTMVYNGELDISDLPK